MRNERKNRSRVAGLRCFLCMWLPEKEYEKAYFTDAPRRVLAHLLRQKPQVRDLLRWMSDPEEIAAIVKGTPLAAYLDPGAPAQRAGILSSMNMVADSLELLPQYARGRPPSVC